MLQEDDEDALPEVYCLAGDDPVPVDFAGPALKIGFDPKIVEESLHVRGVFGQVVPKVLELVDHRGHDERKEATEHQQDREDDQDDGKGPRHSSPHHPLDEGKEGGVKNERDGDQEDDWPELGQRP